MATRQARIEEFPNEPDRAEGELYELLCEDNRGSYALPFLCKWHNNEWWNHRLMHRIESTVIGWRAASAGK